MSSLVFTLEFEDEYISFYKNCKLEEERGKYASVR